MGKTIRNIKKVRIVPQRDFPISNDGKKYTKRFDPTQPIKYNTGKNNKEFSKLFFTQEI